MRLRRVVKKALGLRSERGAALAEFALVVPFLMIMMCATIDFGLAVYTLNNLTAAVREGGRFAATLPKTSPPLANDTRVRDRVYQYIVGINTGGLSAQDVKNLITVTPPAAPYTPPNDLITVQIRNFPFRPMTPLAPLINMTQINLNRTAVFRWEMAN
jgi:Flp pilus assembly protein TadG